MAISVESSAATLPGENRMSNIYRPIVLASRPTGWVAPGATMIGGTVGEVVGSNHPAFAAGNPVRGMLGWSEYGAAAPEAFIGLLRGKNFGK
jgi:NADPH-dependent curcumin reductase CurA